MLGHRGKKVRDSRGRGDWGDLPPVAIRKKKFSGKCRFARDWWRISAKQAVDLADLLLAPIGWGECHFEAVFRDFGEVVVRKSEVLGEQLVFVLDVIAEADRVVGADRAGDAGVEQLADRVGLGGGDDAELQVADRAHVECDAPIAEE